MDRNQHRQSFSIHPYQIFVYLLIGAITVLFLSLTVAYLYTRVQHGLSPLKVPVIFIFNTFILLASSFCLIKAKRAYKDDNTGFYKKMLLVTIVLSICFMISQAYGWYRLFQSNLPLGVNNGVSYVYLISGVHFAHILAGMPFLIGFYRAARIRMVEPVSVLLYFSDPEKKTRLQLLTLYWHFLDILWIYLVVFFWLNYLLS
ncbi:MAG: cytochrome c oxidase subunit 3 [Saprospiraceae bacterium]|nr:cytochrome c oxidase subunit 3 [Saprospiraceae bacterium]